MSRLHNMKIVTTAAMLVAIAIILGFFKLPISNIIEIRFQSIPIAIAGFLFGPVVGGIVGGLADIGGYVVHPTGAYAPGFTIDTILSGVIFGLIMHHKGEISIRRIVIAFIINAIFVNTLLNSFWLTILYNLPFTATVIARITKEIIMVPIDVLILTVILKPICNLTFTKAIAK